MKLIALIYRLKELKSFYKGINIYNPNIIPYIANSVKRQISKLNERSSVKIFWQHPGKDKVTSLLILICVFNYSIANIFW